MNKDIKSSFFCPAPWTTTCIDPEGAIVPCATYNKDFELDENNKPLYQTLLTNTFEDGYNSETMKSLRKKMVAGEKPKGCRSCHEMSTTKAWVYRDYILELFNSDKIFENYNLETGEVSNPQIQFIDMALTNKCNLKCRMCSPTFCSGLTKEFAELNGAPYEGDNNITMPIPEKILNSKNLKRLKLQGGEPFIDPGMMESMQHVVSTGRASEINLQINTNATLITPTKMEILKNFKQADILCSLDGWGAVNDYIRHPSSWETVYKKLKMIYDFSRTNDNIEFGITTVIQIFNVYHLPEMTKSLYEEFDVVPNFQILFEPSYLSIQILPEQDKHEIQQLYDAKLFSDPVWGPRTERLKATLNFMWEKNESHHLPEFVRITNKVDSMRNQKIAHFCPELDHLFNGPKPTL